MSPIEYFRSMTQTAKAYDEIGDTLRADIIRYLRDVHFITASNAGHTTQDAIRTSRRSADGTRSAKALKNL